MKSDGPDDVTTGFGGALPAPLALLVETKRAMDDGVVEADVLGGYFLEAETPADMQPNAFEQAMREIEALEDELTARRAKGAARAAVKYLDEVLLLPEPVRSAALNALEAGRWRFGGLGLERLLVSEQDGVKAELMRIEPGRPAMRHGHEGREFTLVLQGSFEDETESFGPGAICERGPDDVHRPWAGSEQVCFALVVAEAPLVFKDLLGFIQRLTKH